MIRKVVNDTRLCYITKRYANNIKQVTYRITWGIQSCSK